MQGYKTIKQARGSGSNENSLRLLSRCPLRSDNLERRPNATRRAMMRNALQVQIDSLMGPHYKSG